MPAKRARKAEPPAAASDDAVKATAASKTAASPAASAPTEVYVVTVTQGEG
jgi:hypothetical protein